MKKNALIAALVAVSSIVVVFFAAGFPGAAIAGTLAVVDSPSTWEQVILNAPSHAAIPLDSNVDSTAVRRSSVMEKTAAGLQSGAAADIGNRMCFRFVEECLEYCSKFCSCVERGRPVRESCSNACCDLRCEPS